MQAFSPNLEPVISFSCAEQRFVIQIKSKSSIFLLWIMLLALYLRILYPVLGPKDFLWFSSEGFIVLHFISKSVIYFELILFKIWGLGQSFFLLCYFILLIYLFFAYRSTIAPVYLLKTVPSTVNCFCIFGKPRWKCLHEICLGFLFCPTELCWCLRQHHTGFTTAAAE